MGITYKLQHLISENEAHEEIKNRVRPGVERLDSDEETHCREVPLINDHDPSLLPSLIRRVEPGQPRWKFETKSADAHGPTKPHQGFCGPCFQLTGVRKFLGNDKEYVAYHMEAK